MGLFRNRGVVSSKARSPQTLDEFVQLTLERLGREAAAGTRNTRITFQPSEIKMPAGLWWNALPGQVAQRIQDAGYFIEYADVEGTTGVVLVNIPFDA